MKNSNPDFPPFIKRQKDLLEELKAEIEKLNRALDPEVFQIQKRIDDLSIRVLRLALKNLPKESRRSGEFIIEVPTCGGRLLPGEHRLEIKPGFGIFHPDLPSWAKNHFIKWIREHRAGLWRYNGHGVLRETGIVGIETGMPGPPIELEDIERELEDVECREIIKQRVLEIRGVQREEYAITPKTCTKCTKQAKIRTRKNSATWKMVIDKLVEESLLTKKITRQAFREWLKRHFPDYPWDNV